jgi:exopolyphosphatase/guanosine-5'-triphosphate,3'-diphosphate pyrophosphatase
MKKYLIAQFLIFTFSLSFLSAKIENRAAIDIGSGATNMKILKVDSETNKIHSIVFEKSIPVPYQKHLEHSGNDLFDQDVMNQGMKAIQHLSDSASSFNVDKIIAVATAAFRQAKNAPDYAELIEQKTGVEVKIIDQRQEAILAFRAASSKLSVDPKNLVVWDIGGGSLQIITMNESGSYVIHEGSIASARFKNSIIEKVQGRDFRAVRSPNPISQNEMHKALKLSQEAALEVPLAIQKKIKDPKTIVTTVGNLFYIGIRSLFDGKPTVTKEEFQKKVFSMAGMTDEQLGDPAFTDVMVSNALLVLGFKQALGIEQLTFLNINNADGVATYPDWWNE